MILTCRTGQYQALTGGQAQARDAVRVDLSPVTADQAARFIASHAGPDQIPRWHPVLHALQQPAHPLARALNTPWRLTLAVTVYQQRSADTGDYIRDPADLTGYDDPDAIHHHLLQQFIPASVANTTLNNRNPHRYRPDQVHTWLTVLARHLDTNTDIVLHELWPIAGNRPRVLTSLLAVLLTALPITTMLAIVTTDGDDPAPTAVWCAEIFALIPGIFAWARPRPAPTRLDLSRFKTRPGRRRITKWLAIGLVAGPALGLATVLADALTGGLVPLLMEAFEDWRTDGFADMFPEFASRLAPVLADFADGLMFGLTVALTGGLAVALTVALTVGLDPSDTSARTDSRDLIRQDLTRWLTGGLMFGLTFGLMFGLAGGLADDGLMFGLTFGLTFGLAGGLTSGLTDGLAYGLAGGLTFGLTFGLTYDGLTDGLAYGLAGGAIIWAFSGFTVRPAGLASARYLMLLICMKRRLPLRLGRFLNWCYTDAGLIRTAGIAYQFRHRELQNHLISTPPGPPQRVNQPSQ
ncbi:hypothetical protein BJF79_20850 [Actinomadura sp. CNU-125]|nr:hypothetical protein BJF79_20850 [Actinomadura sp. CNU-125]